MKDEIKTEEELFDTLRSEDFFYDMLRYVEEKMSHHFSSCLDLCPDIETLKDYAKYIEDDPSQQTVVLSVPIARLVEIIVPHLLRQRGFKIVASSTVFAKGTNKDGEEKTGACDFTVELGEGVLVDFEIKTTQGDDFQGSTHSLSAGKSLNLFLFKYSLNKDYKLPEPGMPMYGAITGAHFAVLDSRTEMDWGGQESKNNSRTSGKVHNTPESAWTYRECLVHGEIQEYYAKNPSKRLKNLKPLCLPISRTSSGLPGINRLIAA